MSKILIADDEEMNREVLRELLEAKGYQVREAADGVEAFGAASTEIPDLVLMDIRMPRADGFAVLAKLRANPSTAQIPVVAVTAFAMMADQERARAAGFDGYVTKPVDFQVLLGTIQKLLTAPKSTV